MTAGVLRARCGQSGDPSENPEQGPYCAILEEFRDQAT